MSEVIQAKTLKNKRKMCDYVQLEKNFDSLAGSSLAEYELFMEKNKKEGPRYNKAVCPPWVGGTGRYGQGYSETLFTMTELARDVSKGESRNFLLK